MKNILISTRNLITKFLLKVYKYLENRRNRYKVYVLSIVFSFLAVYILYYVLELFKLKKYISIFNGFFVSIMTFAFIFLLVDLMTVFIDFIIDEINKKNYEKKMKKIKASYSGWVQNSQFGQVYDVLSYLDAKVIENNDSLSDLIKSSYSSLDSLEDTNDYLRQFNNINKFDIYNKIILLLSKLDKIELKNLLSFLELEPKKNGLIFFIKPIIKLIITSIIIPIIVKISNMLVDNNNSFKVVTEKFTIRNIIVNVIQHPVLNYIILVILLVLVIFISIYKNEQIDDPHMKEYLKKSLTRAIEIKEENNAVGLHCESTAESLEKTEL